MCYIVCSLCPNGEKKHLKHGMFLCWDRSDEAWTFKTFNPVRPCFDTLNFGWLPLGNVAVSTLHIVWPDSLSDLKQMGSCNRLACVRNQNQTRSTCRIAHPSGKPQSTSAVQSQAAVNVSRVSSVTEIGLGALGRVAIPDLSGD